MQTITPFLWFDTQAEEAANFYTSIFKDSMIDGVTRSGETGSGDQGAAISVKFQLDGQEYIAFNGGPHFTFNPAISLFVKCETQAEVDDLWAKLTEGGEEVQCGWLKDRFGVSWQVVPDGLTDLLYHDDPEKARRAMEAMLPMKKIDLAKIKMAADGG